MEIAPVDLMDGGAPGGNIRPGGLSYPLVLKRRMIELTRLVPSAVLYRSDRLELDTFSPTVGTNQQSQSFVSDPTTGETTFALTPGLSELSLSTKRTRFETDLDLLLFSLLSRSHQRRLDRLEEAYLGFFPRQGIYLAQEASSRHRCCEFNSPRRARRRGLELNRLHLLPALRLQEWIWTHRGTVPDCR